MDDIEKKNKFFTMSSFIVFVIFLSALIYEVNYHPKNNRQILAIIIYASLVLLTILLYYGYYRNAATKRKNVLKAIFILLVGFFSLIMNEKIVSVSEDITLLKYSIAYRKEESIENSDDFVKIILKNLDNNNSSIDDNLSIDEILAKYDFADQTVLLSITAENIDKSIKSLEYELLQKENSKVNLTKFRTNLTLIGILVSFVFTLLSEESQKEK